MTNHTTRVPLSDLWIEVEYNLNPGDPSVGLRAAPEVIGINFINPTSGDWIAYVHFESSLGVHILANLDPNLLDPEL